MGRGLRRMASLLVLTAALALAASSTHAPHLPELLGGMHTPQLAGRDTMMPAQVEAAPRFAAADAAMQEVWCAVVGLAPTTQLLFLQIAATVLLTVAFSAQRASSPGSRTKPPPVAGARLRATLQVFRN